MVEVDYEIAAVAFCHWSVMINGSMLDAILGGWVKIAGHVSSIVFYLNGSMLCHGRSNY